MTDKNSLASSSSKFIDLIAEEIDFFSFSDCFSFSPVRSRLTVIGKRKRPVLNFSPRRKMLR